MTYYLDSTVAMYAASRAQRYKQAAIEVLRAVAASSIEAATSATAIEDIMYRFAGLGRPEEGVDLADQFMRVVPVVYELTSADLSRAFTLMRAEPRLSFRVAVHGAIMQAHSIQAIITVDTAFDLISACTRTDLATWQPPQ